MARNHRRELDLSIDEQKAAAKDLSWLFFWTFLFFLAGILLGWERSNESKRELLEVDGYQEHYHEGTEVVDLPTRHRPWWVQIKTKS